MGLWLNEGIIGRPDKLDAAVFDLADSGFGVIRVMLRNTNFSHRSPQVIAAVGRIVAAAHGRGLQVVLDCEPHGDPVARDMGSLYPDATGFRVIRATAKVVDGRFTAHIPASRASGGLRSDYGGLSAVYFSDGRTIKKIENLKFDRRTLVEPYSAGFTTRENSYTEGRPGMQWIHVHLSGSLPDRSDGTLIFYVRFNDPRLVDFSSPSFRRYYDELLECYRDIPLDGVGWDEPGTSGHWQQYLCGDSFLQRFERSHGYSLNDNWYQLDEPGTSAESLKVRLDYYHTQNEAIFDAQQNLFAKARELFGEQLILGTHHTWQGEGGINDFRSGAVDYFRLNDNMDAGYTDCWWWDIKSVCYAYTLASSLGRLTPSGEAEVNTWDTKPTISRVQYHARLMTLYDITWFNIWYGETTDTCLYPTDYTWPATVRAMRQHRDSQRLIGAAKPVVEIAILHGWETVCGINQAEIASGHKGFCLNMAQLFVDRSVAFDWIDTRLLASSTSDNGRLTNALGSYSILIMPYASILPREAWDACRQFAEAGGKLVFVGPPPALDLYGESLSEEFAELMQMPVLPLARYIAGVSSVCTLPLNRQQQLDVIFPLSGDENRLHRSIEGEPNRLDNAAGNVVYLSDLDPRERLLQLLAPWVQPEVTCYSDSIQWRLYRTGTRSILICIARQDLQLRGLIRIAGEEIEFTGGTLALIEHVEGTLEVIGDDLKFHIRRTPQATPSNQEFRGFK